jgi:cyanate lyase
MDKAQVTDAILKAKKNKGLSWATIAGEVGMSELWVASCAYGENSMTPISADKLCSLLDLGAEVRDSLLDFPLKGNSLDGKLVPTDPLLYRFYEILVVYGKALKDSIQEKCGDGIMSAVDFTIDVQKVEHPKGDRIVVTMDGKFLAYKRF